MIVAGEEVRYAEMTVFVLYRIIRGNDYIFRSEEQQHSFNYPVQIGTHSKSTPRRDAQRYSVKVQKDDVRFICSSLSISSEL